MTKDQSPTPLPSEPAEYEPTSAELRENWENQVKTLLDNLANAALENDEQKWRESWSRVFES